MTNHLYRIVDTCANYSNRRDAFSPWNPQSQWYSLRTALEEFRSSLPPQQCLTPRNTSAHINIRTSTPYTLVHTTVSLCQILLSREYLPFIPFRHGRPQGPLDGTRAPFPDPTAPQGFWEDNARECFSAARDIVDLLRTCQEWGVAVETPIVGFAIYNVALLGVYLTNFPWMDSHGYLRRVNDTREEHVPHGAEAARKVLEMVGSIRPRLHMAEGWLSTIKRAHKYFSRLRTSWFDSAPRMGIQGIQGREVWNDQSIATAQLHPPDAESTRVLFERALRELDGGDEDDDVEMSDAGGNGAQVGQAESDASSPRVKPGGFVGNGGNMTASTTDQQQYAQQEERWNAINSVAAAASAFTATTNPQTPTHAEQPVPSNSAHFRFFTSYGPSSSSGAQSTTGNQQQQHSFRPSFSSEGSASSAQQQQQQQQQHQQQGGSGQPHSHAQTPSAPPPPPPSWTTGNRSGGSREAHYGAHAYAPSPISTANASARRGSEAGSLPPFSASTASSSGTVQGVYPGQQQQRGTGDKEIRDAEGWLAGLEKGFGADDVAAFVDGMGVGEIAERLAREGKGGWLSVVWGFA